MIRFRILASCVPFFIYILGKGINLSLLVPCYLSRVDFVYNLRYRPVSENKKPFRTEKKLLERLSNFTRKSWQIKDNNEKKVFLEKSERPRHERTGHSNIIIVIKWEPSIEQTRQCLAQDYKRVNIYEDRNNLCLICTNIDLCQSL